MCCIYLVWWVFYFILGVFVWLGVVSGDVGDGGGGGMRVRGCG